MFWLVYLIMCFFQYIWMLSKYRLVLLVFTWGVWARTAAPLRAGARALRPHRSAPLRLNTPRSRFPGSGRTLRCLWVRAGRRRLRSLRAASARPVWFCGWRTGSFTVRFFVLWRFQVVSRRWSGPVVWNRASTPASAAPVWTALGTRPRRHFTIVLS